MLKHQHTKTKLINTPSNQNNNIKHVDKLQITIEKKYKEYAHITYAAMNNRGTMNHQKTLFKTTINPQEYIVKKSLILLVLGVLLYIGIIINYTLLNISIPIILNAIYTTAIILFIIIQILLDHIHYAKYSIAIDNKGVEIANPKPQHIAHSAIKKVHVTMNMFDKMYRTSTVTIQTDKKTIVIHGVENANTIHFHLQKNK